MAHDTTTLAVVGTVAFVSGYVLHRQLSVLPKTHGSRRRSEQKSARASQRERAGTERGSEGRPEVKAHAGGPEGESQVGSEPGSELGSELDRETDRETDSEGASELDSEYDSGSESDDISIDSTPLNSVPGEVRMTLVVRQDLKMGKGKAAAQCSHATLALYKKMSSAGSAAYNPEMLRRWEYGNGQAKITLQVPDQEEMDMLFAQAMSLGINAYIVHDAGRTQIAAGSATVLGLGPAPKSVMDTITGGLKLY